MNIEQPPSSTINWYAKITAELVPKVLPLTPTQRLFFLTSSTSSQGPQIPPGKRFPLGTPPWLSSSSIARTTWAAVTVVFRIIHCYHCRRCRCRRRSYLRSISVWTSLRQLLLWSNHGVRLVRSVLQDRSVYALPPAYCLEITAWTIV